MATAAAIPNSSPDEGILKELFGPTFRFIKIILRGLSKILIMLLLVAVIFVGGSFAIAKYQTGALAATVDHGEIIAEEQIQNPILRITRKYSPDLYAQWTGTSDPYAIDPLVERTASNKDVGVKIIEFKPLTEFKNNSAITVRGRVKAQSLGEPITIEAFCYLEGYETNVPIPAQILGTNSRASNSIIISSEKPREFGVNCVFPKGISVEKQINKVQAKLILIYDFTTKSYGRIWALDNNVLTGLQNEGVDPFKKYSVQDPLLTSNKRMITKSTPAPMSVSVQIDDQPVTTGSAYDFTVAFKRTLEDGNFLKLNSLTIAVPAVQDLDINLQGEGFIGTATPCDFELVGETEEGFREYKLADSKLQEINEECDNTLIAIITSKKDCRNYFTQPVFGCYFSATKTPQTLQSDIIKANAQYTYKVEKSAAVEITAPPPRIA